MMPCAVFHSSTEKGGMGVVVVVVVCTNYNMQTGGVLSWRVESDANSGFLCTGAMTNLLMCSYYVCK